MKVTLTRRIDAPIETVFEAVSRVGRFSGDADGLAAIERLKQRGSGAAAHEPFRPGGPRGSPVFEVTQYQPPERVGIVSQQGDTRWETLFSVRAEEGGTLLAVDMTATAARFSSRIVLPFMRRSISKAIANDLDAVARWCERTGDKPNEG